MSTNAIIAVLTVLALSPAATFAQIQFFAGKTITVVLGGPPAGSVDQEKLVNGVQFIAEFGR